MAAIPEPKRETSLDTLTPGFKTLVQKLLANMVARGFDPVVFEARRSPARQKWLYGVGRTHSLNRKPVTWTLKSRHLPGADGYGQAVDIISKKRGWDWPEFFSALKDEAHKLNLVTIPQEGCHVQYR